MPPLSGWALTIAATKPRLITGGDNARPHKPNKKIAVGISMSPTTEPSGCEADAGRMPKDCCSKTTCDRRQRIPNCIATISFGREFDFMHTKRPRVINMLKHRKHNRHYVLRFPAHAIVIIGCQSTSTSNNHSHVIFTRNFHSYPAMFPI